MSPPHCLRRQWGLEAAKRIKQRPGTVTPKIVFLTAHALKEYQEKALESGGSGFVSKPFQIDYIRETLLDLFELQDPSERKDREES